MQIKALRMNVYPGQEAEYKRRHDEICPQLKQLLKSHGISEYRIFLDTETHALFGIFSIEDETVLPQLAQEEVMKKWWAYMKDIMPSNEDNSPVSFDLEEVFYLP